LNAGELTIGNGKNDGGVIFCGISKALKWLVYSNLFCAVFYFVAMTAAMMVLLRIPVNPALLFIAFSGSMVIYSLNRSQDRQEDQINLPERSDFSLQYGRYFIIASVPVFGFSILLAALQGYAVLAVVLMPFLISVLYSYFRLKRVFLVKNLAVSLAASAVLLVVVAAYRPDPSLWLPLFGFFFLTCLVNAIVYDIKDIAGDTLTGIRTLPVTIGPRMTQVFCFILLVLMIPLSVTLIQADGVFWALVPSLIYKGLYIGLVPVENPPWWFYGIVVDGEGIPLLGSSLLFR
jgi:4-hydroxybenzoate polyprenyltransferase